MTMSIQTKEHGLSQATQTTLENRPAETPVEDDPVRGMLYRLLANLLYRPPQGELLGSLAALEPQEAESGPMAEALQLLRLAGDRATAEAVDDEFHALFIGVGRGELMPYGSWYLTGFLMDRPLAVLRKDLAALGIERAAEVREPEDHAAALCESMALLCADPAVDPAQQGRFFAEHIEPWMGVFFDDMQKASSACFYRAVGRLGEQFVEFERKYLNMPA